MNRAGDYKKNLSGEMEYFSFKPTFLPLEKGIAVDEEMLQKTVRAATALGKINALSEFLSDSELFISMYVRKEALISSQIEGTRCTLDDIFDPNVINNTNLDVAEVVNYVKATQYAIEKYKELPLCNRLIKEVHKKLLDGTRGKEKNPGEFRKSQNWIGHANCSLREAKYVPPTVEDMISSMNNLEEYINNGIDYDPLIRAALIHYQFETIHPFLDGNGRIGRLLILLYLMEQRCLSKPILYISYYLKKNQIEYYDRMSMVRKTGDYEQWIKFFLDAIYNAAKDSEETILKLKTLHEKNIKLIPKSNRKQNIVKNVFEYIELHPIIEIKKTAQELKISYNSAAKAALVLEEIGVLKEITNNTRNRVFVYEDLLAIIKKDTE